MLEKLKSIIKYSAKLLLWSCWLGIQGFELVVRIIFDVFLYRHGGSLVNIMTSSDYRGKRLRAIGSKIIKIMRECKEEFFRRLYAIRYPVCSLCSTSCCDTSLLLKLFLMVGFSPNEEEPLSKATFGYLQCAMGLPGEDEVRVAKSILKKKMRLLVEYGADINCQTTALKSIIRLGWMDELDFLIKKGADVNSSLYFEDGLCSPTQYAANWGAFDVALLLIDKGASFEYSDIPQIFGRCYYDAFTGYTEAKIVCEIYNRDSNAVGELLQSYKNKRRDGVHHDKIEPIFRNVLSQHILPKVQDEQIKNQLNDFIYGTDNSIQDISAQDGIQNNLQNLRERQAEVVTIENVGKAQRGTERLSISSN